MQQPLRQPYGCHLPLHRGGFFGACHRIGCRLGRCFCFTEVSAGHPHPNTGEAIFCYSPEKVDYPFCGFLCLLGIAEGGKAEIAFAAFSEPNSRRADYLLFV